MTRKNNHKQCQVFMTANLVNMKLKPENFNSKLLQMKFQIAGAGRLVIADPSPGPGNRDRDWPGRRIDNFLNNSI